MTPKAGGPDARLTAAMELLARMIQGNTEEIHAFRTEGAADTKVSDRPGSRVKEQESVNKVSDFAAAGGVITPAVSTLLGKIERLLGAGLKMAMEGVSGALTSAGRVLVLKFAAIMSPMAMMANIINSNASGFQVLGSAVKVFAATLAPILLPITAALAAGLVYLSDKVWDDLAPALEGFYSLVFESLVPAIKWLAETIGEVIGDIVSFVDALNPFGGGGGGSGEGESKGSSARGGAIAGGVAGFLAFGPIGGVIGAGVGAAAGYAAGGGGGEDDPVIARAIAEEVERLLEGTSRNHLDMMRAQAQAMENIARKVADDPAWYSKQRDKMTGAGELAPGTGASGGADFGWGGTDFSSTARPSLFGGWLGSGGTGSPGGSPGEPAGGRGTFAGAMADTIKELRNSMGPRAQFTGLAMAGRNAQLAALNSSPFEQRMLERMSKALELLERVSNNTRERGTAD